VRRRKTEEDDTSNKDQEGAAAMFFLQIKPWRRVWPARACPRVPELMYPSRTRAVLSVGQTANKPRSRQPCTDGMAGSGQQPWQEREPFGIHREP